LVLRIAQFDGQSVEMSIRPETRAIAFEPTILSRLSRKKIRCSRGNPWNKSGSPLDAWELAYLPRLSVLGISNKEGALEGLTEAHKPPVIGALTIKSR
jgi:hypothetical protein